MRSKKFLSLAGIVFLSLIMAALPFLTACPAPEEVAPPPEEEAPAPPEEGEVPTFDLKLTSNLAGAQMRNTTDVFIPLAEKLTMGTVKITAYDAGTLVPMTELLEAISVGAVDMMHGPPGYWAGVVPVAELVGLPYAFRSSHEAWFFMYRRGFLDILRQEFAKQNVYIIPYECYGTGLMTNKPIEKVADLEGMKIRAYGSMAKWLEECGASTVYLPGGELYTALATGVAEGAHWADAGPMYEMKFQEVLKNYMLPDPVHGEWNFIYVNMDLWNELTPSQRNSIEVAALAGGQMTQNQTRLNYKRALDSMAQDFGVNVTMLPEEEQAKMRELAIKSWEKLAEKNPLNANVISMIEDFAAEEEVPIKVILPYPW